MVPEPVLALVPVLLPELLVLLVPVFVPELVVELLPMLVPVLLVLDVPVLLLVLPLVPLPVVTLVLLSAWLKLVLVVVPVDGCMSAAPSDDIGEFLPLYLENKVLAVDPFVQVDTEGVGALIQVGREGAS